MKWQIPDMIYILGVLHTVEIRQFGDEDCDKSGLYDPCSRSIHIGSDQQPHLQPEIFIHEIIEGINDMADLRLKHHQICTIALGVHDVFRNQLKEGNG